MKRKTINQPRYVGGRIPAHSGFIPALEHALRKEMRRFGVSRSFVIATCVAYTLRVEDQPDYAKLPAVIRLVDNKKGVS